MAPHLRRCRLASAQRLHGVAADRSFERTGNDLTIGRLVKRNRFTPRQHHIYRAAAQYPNEMGSECEIAIPGNDWAVLTTKWKAMQTRIGDRQWLEPYAPGVAGSGQRVTRCADERGAERHNAIAIARRSLA